MNPHLALLADIGGTNARFALADLQLGAPLMIDSIREFEVAGFPSLAGAARHYMESQAGRAARIGTGVFAVAGRIDGDEARITNHPWVISRRMTQQALGLDHLHVVNDFSAQAMAIQLLTASDLVAIGDASLAGPGSPRTFAVLGPGTGLGVSALIVREGRALALETEGGHVSFAANSPLEAAILEQLLHWYPRVSNERLVSGGGLVNIHRALRAMAGEPADPVRPSDVTAGARSGDARCAQAVDVFCSIFGSVAGDLVLTLGAWDGVFLTGGLVPILQRELQRSGFRSRFDSKGRFSAAMAAVPAMAVMHPHAGLLGAAAFARQDACKPATPGARPGP